MTHEPFFSLLQFGDQFPQTRLVRRTKKGEDKVLIHSEKDFLELSTIHVPTKLLMSEQICCNCMSQLSLLLLSNQYSQKTVTRRFRSPTDLKSQK